MATHALGKLKFNLSKDGLAYRWGDGQVRRLFGKKASAEDTNNEAYPDGVQDYSDPGFDDGRDYDSDPGYDDDFDAPQDRYSGDYRNEGYQDDGYDDGGYQDDGYDDDGYQDDGYSDGGYQDDGYSDGGYQDDGYNDDGYQDDGYNDAGYQDDGYNDAGYQDDGYDDAGYDDDYPDDRYDDDGGYDDGYQDDGYDDRYSDQDAGDGYAGEDRGAVSPLMQYVEENDWVTYLLLFLFPPLGIYLLWRRRMLDRPVRIAVSVISGIWFIVALALIFSRLFGAPQDTTHDATITLAPAMTAAPGSLDLTGDGGGVDVTVDNVPGGTSSDSDSTPVATAEPVPTVEPSPTPLAGGAANSSAGGTTQNSNYVYSPATGMYYHSRSDCENIGEGVSVSRVPREVAENSRKQSACPVCIGAGAEGGEVTTYYATRDGKYYHLDQKCQDMKNATPYTKEAAEKAGKTPCPVCVTKTANSLKAGDLKFITSKTTDQSKLHVFTTKKGKYYHLNGTCSGMKNANRVTLRDALLDGKTACPTCCKAAGATVYCTKDGKFYHTNKTCSGMKDALETTLAEALVLGKTRCHTCVKSGSLPTASQLKNASTTSEDGTYVYGTAGGKYYHTDANCSGMKDAQRYTLKSMLAQKRQPCPVCAKSAKTVVYTTKSGRYYHSYATCSGITSATESSMAEAISHGYKRCPKCWTATTSMAKARGKVEDASNSDASAPSATATASNTFVYATKEGSYYHLTSNCSGMKGASRITLKQAINAGKKACPNCAGSSKRIVYSTEGGKNYHAASECKDSGMKGGKAKTLAEALMQGQTACKYCIGRTASSGSSKSTSSKSTSSKTTSSKSGATTTVSAKTQTALQKAAAKLVNSHTYKSGKSGIKVYARADSKHFHRNSSCSGMKGASRLTLETAMNYGKTPCPKCCASARRTVYATRGGKYYHNSREHAGSGASKISMASALGYGYKACPYCVTKTKSLAANGFTNTYKSGTSGIKVYATVDGKYYHSRSSCGDMKSPSHISLETAMNYGKKPCPKCMGAASRKVYSSSGDKYYHYYKAHAGSGARAGTLAQARATGKKLCPQCSKAHSAGVAITSTVAAVEQEIQRYEDAKSSTVSYSAPASTPVYVDPGNPEYYYYHKSSKCSGAGMSHGKKVTLQYAKDWQYKACPVCHPATSID